MSFQFSAPTDLAGTYSDGSATLTWDASAPGHTTVVFSTSNFILPTNDFSSITFTGLGPAGGGSGGDSGYGQGAVVVGGGGGGGAYVQTTIPAAAFTGLTEIPIVIGTGGAGGPSQTISYPPGGALPAINGIAASSATTVNTNWIVCGAGGPGLGGTVQTGGAGGTGSVLSGLGAFDTTIETGGAGGSGGLSAGADFHRPGASTTNAGPGGGGGGTMSGPGGSGGVGPGFGQSGGSAGSVLGGVGVAATFPVNGATSAYVAPPTGAPASSPDFGAGGGGAGGVAAMTNSGGGFNATASAGTDGGTYGAGGGGGGTAAANGIGNNFACTAVGGAGGAGRNGVMIVTVNYDLPAPGYIVYRGGVPIGTVASGVLTYTDTSPTSCTSVYTVAATLDGSTPDSDPSSSATVNVPASVTLTPATAIVSAGQTQQFTATTNGAAVSVWAVDGISGGDSTVGTVNGSGLFTAPIVPPDGGAVTVSATVNCTSGNATADSTVTILPGGAVKMGTTYATALLYSQLTPAEDAFNPLQEE